MQGGMRATDTLAEAVARDFDSRGVEPNGSPRGAPSSDAGQHESGVFACRTISWRAVEEGPSALRAKIIKPILALLAVAGLCLACVTPSPQPDPLQQARQAHARLEIGIDHLRNGRQALALRDFLFAQSLDPDSARIQLALGDGYLASGRMEVAESHFRRALELDPDEFDARMNLSAILIHDGRHPEALYHCQILIDDPTFPAPWRALNNQGRAQLELGELSEARESFERALDYGAEFWPATLSLGILAHREGQRQEALGLFEQVLVLEPGTAVASEVHYRLGEIYVALGRREEAVAHLDRSVEEAPRSRWARKSEAYVKLIR